MRPGRGELAAGLRRQKFRLACLEFAAVDSVLPKQLLDAQELVVFRHAVGAAQRPGLDLAGVGRHGNVRDGRVFRLAGAMADDRGVIVVLRQFDGVQRLGERADLVHFHQDRIRRAGVDATLQELHVRDEQVIADELNLVAQLVGELLPGVQIRQKSSRRSLISLIKDFQKEPIKP